MKIEVENMLRVRIIKPKSMLWTFSVVISRKNDGHLLICIDYRTLNKLTKAGKFCIPNVEKLLEYMAGTTCFSKPDMFACY